jgi:glycosyltransferase involved in cell wall biosynthesis
VNEALRIGIDARELIGDATGVGRYLGELLRRWIRRSDAHTRDLVLYSPESLPMWALTSQVCTPRVLPGGRGTWWEQTTLRRAVGRDRLDVFFAPAYTAPVGLAVPFAVTIHDISFIARPRWFRPRERWRRRLLTAYAARHAAVVFTDSEFSRSEIEKHLNVRGDGLFVIPPGVTTVASRTKGGWHFPGESASPLFVPDPEDRSPLVLYTGSIFNRRRLPDLIAAFARAVPAIAGARLVIVGADRTWPRQDLRAVASAHNVSAQVEVRDYVSQEELEGLYRRASVFAFLSEYEGFGLTPLEALSAGVPVVVLDTPVAREVYGRAATYVGPSIDDAAQAIRRLLTSRDEAADTLASAADVIGRYSWDRAADETLDRIERVARLRTQR